MGTGSYDNHCCICLRSHEYELKKRNERIAELETENKEQYRKGYNDGLTAFAWWKDGVQYVGTCGRTLKQALKGGD